MIDFNFCYLFASRKFIQQAFFLLEYTDKRGRRYDQGPERPGPDHDVTIVVTDAFCDIDTRKSWQETASA